MVVYAKKLFKDYLSMSLNIFNVISALYLDIS